MIQIRSDASHLHVYRAPLKAGTKLMLKIIGSALIALLITADLVLLVGVHRWFLASGIAIGVASWIRITWRLIKRRGRMQQKTNRKPTLPPAVSNEYAVYTITDLPSKDGKP